MKNGILVVVVIAALLAGCLASGSPKEGKTLSQGELRQVTLKIDGMVCPACPQTIKAALLQLEGVEEVDISLERQGGTVIYDATKITAKEIATSNIFSWGVYKAEVVDDRPLGEKR